MRSKIGFVSGIVLIVAGIVYVPINQFVIIVRYFNDFDCPTPPLKPIPSGQISFWACPPLWFDIFLTIIIPAIAVTAGLVLATYYSRKPKIVKDSRNLREETLS